METREKLEFAIISSIAAICILIPLLDFIGALESVPWLSKKVPTLTLLAVASISSYLISERYREFRKIEDAVIQGNIAILKKISLDETHQRIIDTIDGLWAERELDIQRFFDDTTIKMATQGNITIQQHLRECQKKFDDGDIFGTKIKFPWDMTFAAINYKGDLIYHENDEMVATRIAAKYPYSEVLKRKTGSLIWFNNYTTTRFKNVFPYKLFKPALRITKIYFREIDTLQAIVTLESHIYVLSKMPKHFSVQNKEVVLISEISKENVAN